MAHGGARIPSGAGPDVDRSLRVLRLAQRGTVTGLWKAMAGTTDPEAHAEMYDAWALRLDLINRGAIA